jgi:mannose-6-phosphate isomerase
LTAGCLHAYLEGVGIELMANSDNVLRGGLTAKHIDPRELTRIVRYDTEPPRIFSPPDTAGIELVFPTAAEEFQLSMLTLSAGEEFKAAARRSIEILIVIEGHVTIEGGRRTACRLRQGESVMVPACIDRYAIRGQGRLYRATVPRRQN